MSERTARAQHAFDSGLNCAQSVVTAFAGELPGDAAEFVKAAAPLGGGIARMGETCGAVTGALILIGLKYGSSDPDAENKARVLERSQELIRRFTERHGTTCCRELTGCNVATPEGRAFAQERQVHRLVCSILVHDATSILEEMIEQEVSSQGE